MPQGPFGGPRPLARCSLAVQVTAADGVEFTESRLTDDIQQLDRRFSTARREGEGSAVMMVENATVIANGHAARFKVSPVVMNREQFDTSLDMFEEHFGDRVSTIAVTIADK